MKTILLVLLMLWSTFLFAQVTDIDGNVYGTVKVGSKTWMTENLRVTKLNDGTAIKFNVSTDTAKASIWTNFTVPAYCWQNDNKTAAIANGYGALYNYHCVYTKKLCPTGWHVPTRVEFDSLVKYADGANHAGSVLKSTTGWKTRNGVDRIGFNAKPAGDRWCCPFQNTGILAGWWTSDDAYPMGGAQYPYGFSYTYMMLDYDDWFNQSNYNQTIGTSVRCVK